MIYLFIFISLYFFFYKQYIAEISPPKYRGALGSVLQLCVTLGILIIQCIGLGLQSSIGWRVATVITVGPAIIQMVCLPFCPRSPRWLISHDRIEEARAEMLRVRNGDIDVEFNDMLSNLVQGYDNSNNDTKKINNSETDSVTGMATTVNEKQNPTSSNQNQSLSIFQLMSIPVLAKLTVKIMLVHVAGQLTGINAIMYYSTSIFQVSFGENAKYVSIGVSALNVVLTVVSLLLIDRLGRKILLLISAVGMCVFSVVMTISLIYSVSPLQVLCIMLFVAFYAVGLGVIPFVLTAEVYPTYAVGTASSIALVVNWLCNFIIGLIFPSLQIACGSYVFLIFAGICFLVALFVAFFVPETKQKSIEELGHQLGWADLDLNAILKNKN